MLDINRIHSRLFEMAKTTKKILENNDIPYTIAFGSLIGAIRHKGFVPWDCDFDLVLFADQYEKAKQVLRENLPDDMILQDELNEPQYYHAWAHVKDKNSIACSKNYKNDDVYIHRGLSVDLYIATRIDRKKLDLFCLKENLKYRERLHKSGLIDDTEFKRNQNDLMKQIQEEEKKISAEDLGDIYALPLPRNYRIMGIDELFPLKRYQFQDELFWGPYNADKMLTRIYGEYMKLPPVEERLPNYDSVVFLEKKF